MKLESSHSLEVSLQAIRHGKGNIDQHRQSLLNKVKNVGDYYRFLPSFNLRLRDLAYLTAITGHEFALLEGKNEKILFHGNATRCDFPDEISGQLIAKKLRITGHSHPGEEIPVPSKADREALQSIDQKSSYLVSGLNGKIIEFEAEEFSVTSFL